MCGLQVFFALTMAATAVTQSSSFSTDTQKAKIATASIFAIIDRKSEIDPSDESGTTLDNVKGEIELHHVSFKYPSRPDIQIFRDLKLAIPAGKVKYYTLIYHVLNSILAVQFRLTIFLLPRFRLITYDPSPKLANYVCLNLFFQTVALVGESGSGKSTVIALLERFYDPDSGHITLDGIEIQKFKLKWLRQQMGLVSQEPVLFNDTIRANIAYGKGGNATEAEIIAAAEMANAHRFISGLQKVRTM